MSWPGSDEACCGSSCLVNSYNDPPTGQGVQEFIQVTRQPPLDLTSWMK